MRIVIILPNWVGDVVMATPALSALRRRFADSHITHLGRPVAIDTLDGLRLADAAVVDPSSGNKGIKNLLKSINLLRAGRYELAVLLPNSFRTALLAKLAGIGRIAGYARDGRSLLLTDSLRPQREPDGRFTPISAIDYYNALAKTLGARTRSHRLRLAVTRADAKAAEELLASVGVEVDRPLVMLNPGAAFGPSKMWEPKRYALLADMLIERHSAQIIINAAPNERPIAAEVEREMQHKPLINFARLDNTIGLLKGLLRKCSLLVTNDTGARHFAAALGVDVVTVFGSTDPKWSETRYKRERIVRLDVPCSPCQAKLCGQPAGPLYHRCMTAITPEMVLASAEELLSGEGKR